MHSLFKSSCTSHQLIWCISLLGASWHSRQQLHPWNLMNRSPPEGLQTRRDWRGLWELGDAQLQIRASWSTGWQSKSNQSRAIHSNRWTLESCTVWSGSISLDDRSLKRNWKYRGKISITWKRNIKYLPSTYQNHKSFSIPADRWDDKIRAQKFQGDPVGDGPKRVHYSYRLRWIDNWKNGANQIVLLSSFHPELNIKRIVLQRVVK